MERLFHKLWTFLCELFFIPYNYSLDRLRFSVFQSYCIIQYSPKTRSGRALVASRLAKISILVPLSWAALGIFFLLPFEILFTSAIRYKCTCPYVCLFFFFVFEDGYSNATKFDLNYQFSVFIDTSLAFFKKFAFFCSNIFQCNIVPFPW